MPAPSWLEKLKVKWKLKNVGQVIVILIVFACTGITVMLIKRPLTSILAGESSGTWWITVLYYLLILPVYNVLLLAYGFLFGQFHFFWEFEKRFMKRIFTKFRKQ